MEDLTGKTFGRLLVIKRTGTDKWKHSLWLCRCIEGNEITLSGTSLKTGNTQSCGCLRREKTRERKDKNRKINKYSVIDSETMICYANNNGEPFIFDKDDYERIKKYCWSTDSDNYLKTRINKKTILFHRFLLNFPNCEIDHKDRNRKNNKKENLRLATDGQNAINASMRKDNKTGIKGVSWNSKNNNWRVILDINKERVVDKSFTNFTDATIFRLKAEKHFYKEFAPQKHLFEKYGI